MRKIILYNPLSGNGNGANAAQELKNLLTDSELIFEDITKITDYFDFFTRIAPSDELYICGGDGTLNKFVNATVNITYNNKIYYYATGSGNDFLRDIGKEKGDTAFDVSEYIKALPILTVNGKDYRFINGVGVGIDGMCCQIANETREKTKKAVSYTAVVLKCFLFYYKPTNAVVTVDGKRYTYKKVWMAPTMNGRYFGGGMLLAPQQNRLNKEKTVTFLVLHNAGKLKILPRFSSVFKGKHLKYTDMLDIHTGHNITVEFEQSFPLQIDGEIIKNVTSYSVRTADTAVDNIAAKTEVTVK